MPRSVQAIIIGVSLLASLAAWSCGSTREGEGDAALDADVDGDGDADGDADVDGDGELDADDDADTDSDADADIEADLDGEVHVDADTDSDPDGGDVEEPPLEPLFSFAVVADPHVTGSGENAERLAAAVAWINDHTDEDLIDVVLVLGDIGWSGGLELSRSLLDELVVPYAPIIGDNEVQAGDEGLFETTFSDQYDLLADTFDGWQRATTPVWNPEAERESWFTNVAFDHQGVHFVGLDWCARGATGLAGEMGDLHDFDGGTWPWFESVIEELPKDLEESIVVASHIPMHLVAFSRDEREAIEGLLGPYGDSVYANFAGHIHITYEVPVPGGGYDVYVTDATHDDENTVRVVHVEGNGVRFAYTHELVVVE